MVNRIAIDTNELLHLKDFKGVILPPEDPRTIHIKYMLKNPNLAISVVNSFFAKSKVVSSLKLCSFCKNNLIEQCILVDNLAEKKWSDHAPKKFKRQKLDDLFKSKVLESSNCITCSFSLENLSNDPIFAKPTEGRINDGSVQKAGSILLKPWGECNEDPLLLVIYDEYKPNDLPNITLLLLTPRPKVLVAVLEFCATVGVKNIILASGDKSEKGFSHSSLFDKFSPGPLAYQAFIRGICQGAVTPNIPNLINTGRPLSEKLLEYLDMHSQSNNSNQYINAWWMSPSTKRANINIEFPGGKRSAVAEISGNKVIGEEYIYSPDIELNNHHSITDTNIIVNKKNIKKILFNLNGSKISKTSSKVDHIIWAVGPEAGFSDRELGLLEQNNFETVSLGLPILKVADAITAGWSIINHSCN